MKTELLKVRGEVNLIVSEIGVEPSGGLSLDEVKIGVTVSGEGNFGIATLGAEATLELTFKRR